MPHDQEHDEAPKPPAGSAEDNLDTRVDQLLDAVDSLTDEVLAVGPDDADDAPALSGAPQDPTRETVTDDVGLASESPLIQDGHKTPPEEVVGDVDHELDRMERLISSMRGSQADPVPAPAVEEIPEIPDLPEPQEIPDAPESADPVENHPAADARQLDDDIAGDIPDDLDELDDLPSPRERELEQDLDALLATQSTRAVQTAGEPPATATSSPKSAADNPSAAGGGSAADIPTSADWLQNVSLSKLLVIKSRAILRSAVHGVGRVVLDRLTGALEGIDALLGQRIPPLAKELIGYCALGTLAMCLIAVLLALL